MSKFWSTKVKNIFIKSRTWFRDFQISTLVAALVTLIAATFADFIFPVLVPKPDISYEQKLSELDLIQLNLSKIGTFVEAQKRELTERQATVATLQAEQEKLKPLVELDRKIVESLLEAQEERVRRNIWYDRFTGFLFGIASSLVANFIWTLKKYRRQEVSPASDSPVSNE